MTASKTEWTSEELYALIDSLHDGGECWFDHDGGCQEHGYISLKPGQLCPQKEAKMWLDANKKDNR